MNLLDALEARSGLVCLVGAGGKKTTLYRLAAAHPGRVGITATVHIARFPSTLDAQEVITEAAALPNAVVKAAALAPVVAFAKPSPKPGRLAGLEPPQVAQIHVAAGFDVTLIKADGARARWIKAPDTHEPPMPENVTTVIPVVSARAIGEPLSARVAHRIDRVTAVTGAQPDEIITPEHIARLLASESGALKGVGNAVVVPLINMVDNPHREALAWEAARQALRLSRRFDRVILASMKHAEPVVRLVSR